MKLGNPNGAKALLRARKGNRAARATISTAADQRARELRAAIHAIQAKGITTLARIADELNGLAGTRRGGRWHSSSVRNLLARLSA